jgi:multidrug efflux system outer membrane protein
MQRAVDLTTNRFRAGVSSELEVKQAETLFNQTKAQAQALDAQRSQLEHAIAVLEGKAAADFSLPRTRLNGLPPTIPSGLPAELLARRPDIAEVERFVAAANAEIGVAKTAALPHISLTGLTGFESTSMTSLFSWQNGLASLGASAVTPLFTGGRTKAGVDQAWAVYRQSLARYQKTVLTAYQEVEDQLAALRILAGESQSTADAVTTAQQAETIALNRYRSGLVSYLDVVYAQTALLANQRTATQIEGQRMVATVVLIKALGGGWLGVPAQAGTNSNPGASGSGANRSGQPATAQRAVK